METRSRKFKDKQEDIIKEERVKKSKKIAKRLFQLLFILFLIFGGIYAYITNIGTTSLMVYEQKITTERLPSIFHGLKVIVFSDLHYPSTFLDKNLDDLEQVINIRKPDLIFFVGDLLTDEQTVTNKQKQKVQKFLTNLKAKLGKYAVLGETDKEDAESILSTSKFTILKDQYDLIYQKELNPILLIGLDSREQVPNFEEALGYFKEENATQDIFSIALFHHPDTITALNETKQVDFAFAGHSHNGQIRIPSLYVKKKEGALTYFDKHYTVGSTELYISSGLGTSESPYRFFARPSIFFFRFTTS